MEIYRTNLFRRNTEKSSRIKLNMGKCPPNSQPLFFPESKLYSLPLLPLGLWCVVQLVCLMGQDDIPVIHQSPPPTNQWNCGVIVAGNQGQRVLARETPIAVTSTTEGNFTVMLHLNVIHSMIVCGVGAYAAPAD